MNCNFFKSKGYLSLQTLIYWRKSFQRPQLQHLFMNPQHLSFSREKHKVGQQVSESLPRCSQHRKCHSTVSRQCSQSPCYRMGRCLMMGKETRCFNRKHSGSPKHQFPLLQLPPPASLLPEEQISGKNGWLKFWQIALNEERQHP